MSRKGQAFERGPAIVVGIMFLLLLVMVALTVARGPAEATVRGVIHQIDLAVGNATAVFPNVAGGEGTGGSALSVPLSAESGVAAPPPGGGPR